METKFFAKNSPRKNIKIIYPSISFNTCEADSNVGRICALGTIEWLRCGGIKDGDTACFVSSFRENHSDSKNVQRSKLWIHSKFF